MDGRALLRGADALVVSALVASAQVQVWTGDSAPLTGGRAVHSTLAVIITLPLFLRRRYPLPVLGAVLVASWLQNELGAGLGQAWLAALIALYAVGAHAGRRDALLGAAAAGILTVADGISKLRDGEPWDDVVPAWFVVAGIWGLGRWVRSRRQEVSRLQARSEQLEQDREESARQAVAEERARIARELHDLVAHSMGVIVIQSQAAQRVLRGDPAAAERALSSIEVTGRQGMAEMRRLLDILIGSDDGAPLTPQPALRHLDALLDRVRQAGLPVEVSVEGHQRSLPPGVELSAYRIVQEGLTNTLKHAGPARAHVRLRYLADGLEVEVTDDGTGPLRGTADGAGHGLVGMRERVALYAGTLQAGPRPGGGYVVRACIPLDGRSDRP